jgi:hypothetical protein
MSRFLVLTRNGFYVMEKRMGDVFSASSIFFFQRRIVYGTMRTELSKHLPQDCDPMGLAYGNKGSLCPYLRSYPHGVYLRFWAISTLRRMIVMVVVTEELVRVDSVRKNREEYLRERMREHNLSDLFVDLKIRASRDDNYWDLKKATIQAIRRRIKQAPITEESFANVSFGPVQVRMDRWQGSIGYHSPMNVVQHVTKAPDSELEQYGIKALVTNGLDGFTEGYGSLRHDIPPKKHKRRYGWKPDFYTMIDIPTLLAEVLFTNSLIRFAMENVDLIIREFSKAAIEYVRCHRVEESQLFVPSLSWLPLME